MTEFEVAEITAANLEVVAAFWSNYETHLGLYMTILFGYCGAAYVAGSKLSKFQVGIISIMFVAAAEIQVISMIKWANATQSMIVVASEMNPAVPEQAIPYWMRPLGMIVWELGILGCLSFMWSIRRQKQQ